MPIPGAWFFGSSLGGIAGSNPAGRHGCLVNFYVFYVLLTVHLTTVLGNNQLDAQFFVLYLFIPVLNMFRAIKCSSSGESIVSIRPLVYVTRCR